MITHTPPLAGYLLIKTLVARQQPTSILTQLVTIASKCKGLDVCTFHNYVMTELICGVLNSSSTLAHLYCIVSTHAEYLW